MKKADNRKFLYVVSISLILFLAGCLDTGVQNIPSSVNYNSQVKIVNLVAGSGSATVTMNGTAGFSASFGSIAFGDEGPAAGQDFMTVPAGQKTLAVTYGSGGTDNLTLTTESNYKMRVFIVADTSNKKSLVKGLERYIQQTKGASGADSLYVPGFAQVSFLNASPDFIADTSYISGSTDTTAAGDPTSPFTKKLAPGDGVGYAKVKAGSYTLTLFLDRQTPAVTITANLQSQGRYTIVFYDKAASLKGKVFTDD